ncbi:MAG: hypothetical protein QXQ14_03285 [Candidatus Aenigmatarchaeota archaeon]
MKLDSQTLLTVLLILVVAMQAIQAFQVYSIYNLINSESFAQAVSSLGSRQTQSSVASQVIVPSQVGGCG